MNLNKHSCSHGAVILVGRERNKCIEYHVVRDAMKKNKAGLEGRVGAGGFWGEGGQGRV